MRRRTLSHLALVAGMVWLLGCGQAVFTPECTEPDAGTVARPTAAALLSDGRLAVANADPDELYCGGFISYFDANGSQIGDPLFLEVDEGFEANMATLATTATRLWTAGRRYGYLLGIGQASNQVEIRIPEVYAERLFNAGPDYLIGWTARNLEPRQFWFNPDGKKIATITTMLSPLRATVYDPDLNRVWLAFDGGRNVQFVDLPEITVTSPRFPKGVGATYNIRSMAYHDGTVYAADYAGAMVLSFNSSDGSAVQAEPVGFTPEVVRVASDGTVWVLDAEGAIYRRTKSDWQLVSGGFERPVDFALHGERALVLDYTADRLVSVIWP